MQPSTYSESVVEIIERVQQAIVSPNTYVQIVIILACLGTALVFSKLIKHALLGNTAPDKQAPEKQTKSTAAATLAVYKKNTIAFLYKILFPLQCLFFLEIVISSSTTWLDTSWLLSVALFIFAFLVINQLIEATVRQKLPAVFLKWITVPILLLHMTDMLSIVIEVLESFSINLGNLSISAYGIVRVTLFGILLFWLGRTSNNAGKSVIRKQQNLDVRTREVVAKLFEIGIFILASLLFLQVMGINVTTLAVFGGAVGVGLGFGLQSISSNFISGLIILLDRSLSVGDYVEFEEGKIGIVRAMNLRSTTLETFDGKDIVVPNEKFISQTFVNWTHKDNKQRYRVDFLVAYDSDIHKLVPLIKKTVASHPQVINDADSPIEELPDCEIDSFGEYGINMFVEFWMEGIDDGKNRVGGDLLLSILDTLRENGFVIPLPQREVRVVDSPMKISRQ